MKRRLSKRIALILLTLAMIVPVLAAAGCSNKPAGTTFKIGTQGYAEVEILAEIFKQLVEGKTNNKVEHVRNLGSSTAGFEATVSNDLQMFTSFTGTLFLGKLEQQMSDEYRDPDKVFDKTKELLDEKYELYAADPWGYNNTYAIAVPRAWAEANNVTKQGDLAAFASDMVLGCDQTWLSYPGQGYKEYAELYGFEFKEVVPMDFGLIYTAIASKEVDAINCYSTDGQLVAQDLLVLEDDKKFNPPYYGILVLRNDVVEKYPDVKAIADSLKGLITTEQMQELNRQVSVDELEPSVVAANFIKERGLLG